MPTKILDELLLYKIGSTQISIDFRHHKVWMTAIDEGNPQELFWVLEKKDWETLKKYIDDQFKADKRNH